MNTNKTVDVKKKVEESGYSAGLRQHTYNIPLKIWMKRIDVTKAIYCTVFLSTEVHCFNSV